MIENHRNPPAERPALGQRARQPRAPESHLPSARSSRIAVPDMVGAFGRGLYAPIYWHCLGVPGMVALAFPSASAPDCRRAQMQTGTRENLGQSLLPQAWGHKVWSRCTAYRTNSGNLFTGGTQLHQRVRTVLIEALHPRGNRCGRHQKCRGRPVRATTRVRPAVPKWARRSAGG